MVLVTGSTGFLGAHLLHYLLENGTSVRALKRTSSSFSILKNVFAYYGENFENRKSDIEWIDGDVNDIMALEASLEGISQVYHLAALVSFQPGAFNQMQKVNVEGTANLVNLLLNKKNCKLCHVSSIAAIGRADADLLIDEKTIWKPSEVNSQYAISKYGAEREVWRAMEEGLDAVIVNPSIILGPGEINSGSTRLIKTVEKGLKFYTPGINGFVDVRDVVKVMVGLMKDKLINERFILSSENVSYQQLFSWIAAALKKPPPPYKAGRLLSGIAWRFEFVRSKIFGGKPLVTKETARTAGNSYQYSGEKIKSVIPFNYIPIHQSIEEACSYHLKLSSK